MVQGNLQLFVSVEFETEQTILVPTAFKIHDLIQQEMAEMHEDHAFSVRPGRVVATPTVSKGPIGMRKKGQRYVMKVNGTFVKV